VENWASVIVRGGTHVVDQASVKRLVYARPRLNIWQQYFTPRD
jgi:hypothetical protein